MVNGRYNGGGANHRYLIEVDTSLAICGANHTHSQFRLGLVLFIFQIEQQLQENGRYNEGLVLDLHIGQRVDNIREDIQAWFQGTNEVDNQDKQENDESSQGKNVEKHLSFLQDGTDNGKGPN